MRLDGEALGWLRRGYAGPGRVTRCATCADMTGGCPACRPPATDCARLRAAGVPWEFGSVGEWPVHEQYAGALRSALALVAAEASVLLTGPNGRGKSWVAALVVLDRLRAGVECRWEFASLLVRRFQATYASGATETVHGLLVALARPAVLVLDDLGAEKVTESVRADLTCLLTMRASLVTVVTSNCAVEGRRVGAEFVDGLLERYGSQFRSRLRAFELIAVDGVDLRGSSDW